MRIPHRLFLYLASDALPTAGHGLHGLLRCHHHAPGKAFTFQEVPAGDLPHRNLNRHELPVVGRGMVLQIGMRLLDRDGIAAEFELGLLRRRHARRREPEDASQHQTDSMPHALIMIRRIAQSKYRSPITREIKALATGATYW